ncbi:D-alanyl-D-alanine carboxypeptidase [Candidatus Falkowbacteria bacterium]|nr:D-alanyl-D-alanine carboxypeptidase [Candidatus Falkowbacteria bacterium]
MFKQASFKKCKNFLILASLLGVIFSYSTPAIAASTSNPYENLGLSSAVLNANTGQLIGGKNSNQVLPVASLTKLMTALVLLDLKIDLNQTVTISQAELNYVDPYIEAGDITSKINLRAGDKITKNDLWHAMLIASSNEAAITLVDKSGISRTRFVQRMNAKARAFGLRQTKFTEPSGIDPNNLSTAKEMSVIARLAYAKTSISKSSRLPSYKFKVLNTGRWVSILSRNNSLLAMKPIGMKVGYLTEAKMNVALRLNKSGNDRIVVVLHAQNNARRNSEINRLMKQ